MEEDKNLNIEIAKDIIRYYLKGCLGEGNFEAAPNLIKTMYDLEDEKKLLAHFEVMKNIFEKGIKEIKKEYSPTAKHRKIAEDLVKGMQEGFNKGLKEE